MPTNVAKSRYTQMIKRKARELGFDYCGIAEAGFLEEEAPRLENWLKQGKHGKMQYMENHFDKRLDPRKLVDGARSVISFMYNHYPSQTAPQSSSYKISKYAYGRDYHKVIKKKLKALLDFIKTEIGDVNGRCFVDSAPVLDRAWAKQSGNGWVGKNTQVIHPQAGSYFFLGELILDLELEYDGPIKDYCGSCTKCIDACPTEAITPYGVDGSRCISYYTIELKDKIPEDARGKFENWIFGCDICQDVCPWNRFAKPHQEPDFEPSDALKGMADKDFEEITEEVFEKIFRGTPVKRAQYRGIKRNIRFVQDLPQEEETSGTAED